MKQKITALGLCAMLFGLCAPVEAQQPKKVARIGYLSNMIQLVSPSVPMQLGWLCGSLAI
jgi:hypothetical protein